MKDKCVSCNKGKSIDLYWGQCKLCWDNSLVEVEKNNQKLRRGLSTNEEDYF